MYLTEQYNLYQLANHLITYEGFQLFHMNTKADEIWLEKQNRKVSTIIRFVHKGFDWKNHLKSDIANVFQRVTTMKRLFTGKQIDVLNVYITEHEPVDDWEALKKPMVLKEKKPVRMNVFYLSDMNFAYEQSRLFKKMAMKEPEAESILNDLQREETIFQRKQQFHHLLEDKVKDIQKLFSFGKPMFVYLLMVINICMFIILEWNGGSTNTQTLIQNGAIYNPAITNGEWWRLGTSMFLHIGFLHLCINMIALYYLGTIVEKIYGSIRFMIIYLLAGLGGSLASFTFSIHISAGASGALFGLFGALLYFGIIHRNVFKQTMGKNLIFILLINLMIGLLVPQIDMGAHLGGLIFGFLASAITALPNKRILPIQSLALICFVLLFIALLVYDAWGTTIF